MLVLTRKYQEKIRIGNDITITVLRTKGKAVRLGIEAPSSIPVIRGELKFEEDSAESVANGQAAAAPTATSTSRREKCAEPAWTTKRNSAAARRVRAATEVGHRRVARDKVPVLLPRLVSGQAPLRALMEKRSAATV
jgi:carbon storage regulator CsrA